MGEYCKGYYSNVKGPAFNIVENGNLYDKNATHYTSACNEQLGQVRTTNQTGYCNGRHTKAKNRDKDSDLTSVLIIDKGNYQETECGTVKNDYDSFTFNNVNTSIQNSYWDGYKTDHEYYVNKNDYSGVYPLRNADVACGTEF